MSDETAQEKPLRVLHIGKYFPPHAGGMETYLRDLLNVQKRQGLDVMALVHTSKRGLFDNEELVDALDGSTYRVVRTARWFNASYIPISPTFIWSASKAIADFQPDLIHIHHPNSSAAWLLLIGAARRAKWLSHWHSDIVTPSSSWRIRFTYFFYRFFEQLLLRKSARIITTSANYLKNSSALRKYKNKCAVIPLGLDSKRLPTKSAVKPLTRPQNPLLLFIGRLAPYKGLLTLTEAMSNLPNCHLWIAGSGELDAALRYDIERRCLEGRVQLLGSVSDEKKWRLLASCDALILPSNQKTEAFGVVLLEAAHFKVPVVVTDVQGSGMPWVASQLPNSRISRNQDSTHLASTIQSLWDQDSRPPLPSEKKDQSIFELSRQASLLTSIYKKVMAASI